MNDEPEIVMSELCRSIKSSGRLYQIEIYNGEHGDWILEVVTENGDSIVWDDEFSTDQEALNEALKEIKNRKIEEAPLRNVVLFPGLN